MTHVSRDTSQMHTIEHHDRTETDPRTQRTRAAIADAARDLLEESGPDAVTHGQVATRARVSRTTVYKHHATRADLLRAAVDHVGKPFPHEPTGDLRTDLRSFVAHLVEDLTDDERALVFVTFLQRAIQDPEVGTVRDEMIRDATEHFAAMLRAGVRSGQIRADVDPELALAGLAGTFLFRRFMAGDAVDEAGADRIVEAFLDQHRP